MKREQGSRSPSPSAKRERGSRSPSRDRASRSPSSGARLAEKRLAEKSTRGKSPAPPRSYSPTSARGEPSPPRLRDPPPPDALPIRPAVRRSGGAAAVKKVLGAGIAFSAAAPFRRAWAAAAAVVRSASAMLHAAAAQTRPVVHLAAAPSAALIRTLVVVTVISAGGPARFLAPLEPDCLLGHVSSEPAARQAALAAARVVLSLLPVPALQASPLLIPAFERTPASGDPFQTVDRIVAVPFFAEAPPPFADAHGGWLQWLTLAAASPLIYAIVAHAINRVRTYRPTIPRPVLDALMSASTRFRSGAIELRRLGSPARAVKRAPSPDLGSKRALSPPVGPASKRPATDAALRHAASRPGQMPASFSDAITKSLAVDEHLRRTLLAVPSSALARGSSSSTSETTMALQTTKSSKPSFKRAQSLSPLANLASTRVPKASSGTYAAPLRGQSTTRRLFPRTSILISCAIPCGRTRPTPTRRSSTTCSSACASSRSLSTR